MENGTGSAPADLRHLSFEGTWRRYQRTVLEATESHSANGRVHIVAPPGAGKTVIGIELARFFGRRAVVFAPTTTIQRQWVETVGMFAAVDPAATVSDDPARQAPLHVFTYQLIATQERADADFDEAADRLWAETLVDEGGEATLEEAHGRIAVLRSGNSEWYRKEHARYRSAVRRMLLRDDPAAIRSLLHPNALKLVDELVAANVGTVVLDECHHLLDYWALVIRYLVGRIVDPVVVGLTATPADPSTPLEEENYYALLGEVDFEVPTPALVREGTLAPYRDLVRFVQPTASELAFLRRSEQEFVAAQQAITASARFETWLREALIGPEPDDPRDAWASAVATNALFAFAGLRVLRSLGHSTHGIDAPAIAVQEPQFDDWTLVLERFALDVLAPSTEADDHQSLQKLKRSIRPFGLSLTERGLRRSQSAVDRVVSLSDAKAAGAADVLLREHRALGDRLRAAVVCDFDREQARGTLAGSAGAGSARGVHAALARQAETAEALRPVLVTARVVAVAASQAEAIRALLVAASDAPLDLVIAASDDPHVVAIEGGAGTWTPKRYVDLVTRLLDEGSIRCVVGTRGLLGEGWDAPSLNVLVDLTTTTTAQSVQQLRGRSIRLDPADPEKVAHNWDVVAYAPGLTGGANDLQRLLRRHDQLWGVVIGKEYEQARVALEMPALAPLAAPIEKGPRHLDPMLVSDLHDLMINPTLAEAEVGRRTWEALESANARSAAAVGSRSKTRAAWGIGGSSEGLVIDSTRVSLRETNLRTSGYLAMTTRALVRALIGTVAVSALSLFGYLGRIGIGTRSGLTVAAVAAVVGGVVLSSGLLVRTVRRLLVEQPPDLIVLDIGRAVALALSDADLIALVPEAAAGGVWCVEDASRSLRVGLNGSPEDQRLFARSMAEVFSIDAEARYLIRRTDDRLPAFLTNAVWRLLRSIARGLGAGRSADHFLAVPRALARSRKRAEAFALHWSRLVGGGELVDTRDELAATAILEARSASRLQAIADRIQSFGQ